MKHALLTVIALSALTLGIAQANAETTEAPANTAEKPKSDGGCPCCQKMAMMQPKKEGSSGMEMDHGAPAQPAPKFNR